MTKRILLVLSVFGILVSLSAGWAQEATGSKESVTVDVVLDRYIRASGGREAWEKVTSQIVRGVVEIPAAGVRGTFEAYAKVPNKRLLTIDLAGFGTIQEGFDGAVAWVKDPFTGLREKSGLELAATRLEAEFHRVLKLKELYPQIVLKGKETVGGSEVYVLEATPAQGGPERWYFEAQTGLLKRVDVEREGPQGKIPIEIHLEDYRDVEGVRVPFTMRQVAPMFSMTLRLEDVRLNVPIEDEKFTKPKTP